MKITNKKKILLFLIVFCLLNSSNFITAINIALDGYTMYSDAVSEISIEERIAEIRTDENYVKIDDISMEYLNNLVATEDKRFFQHGSIDPIGTTRALITNIRNRRIVSGGSSITQQLAKNMYFSFEKKYERKVAEFLVASQLENMLTKKEILELYCNITYFGEDCYGIKEATNHYYGIGPDELEKEEAVILVDTLKAPNSYNPNLAANKYSIKSDYNYANHEITAELYQLAAIINHIWFFCSNVSPLHS